MISVEVRADGEEDVGGLMQIRNHLYADLAPVLAEQGAVVVQRRGEGYLCGAGAGHARRGVAAALAWRGAGGGEPAAAACWAGRHGGCTPAWRAVRCASAKSGRGTGPSGRRRGRRCGRPTSCGRLRPGGAVRERRGASADGVGVRVPVEGPLLWEAIGPEDAKKEGQ